MKTAIFRKLRRKKHLTTPMLHGGILAVSVVLAVALFSYAVSLPLSFRVRGDASQYLLIADGFSSLQAAFAYTGDRTYGFPLFLYIIKIITAPADIEKWVTTISYTQFLLHIAACFFFYAFFLRKVFQEARLPGICAPLTTGILVTYPALVCYTTTPLTDTFCTDILMIATTAFAAIRTAARGRLVVLCLICGALLGYSIMVRPSFWPPVTAFLAASFVKACLERKNRTLSLIKTTVIAIVALALILPTLEHFRQAQGTFALQNEKFSQPAVQASLQAGLSAVRVYWSGDSSPELIPGVRDPLLDENYGKRCKISSVQELASCLLSRPFAIPAFFAKKTIALFDVPHLQPYAVNITPDWFAPLERVFAAAAFCGFVSLVLLTVSRPFLPATTVWIGLPWTGFVLMLVLVHMALHIEGRYGFPLVPFSLASLFLGFAAARRAGNRFYAAWLAIMLLSALIFICQVNAWDLIQPS